MTLSNFMLNPAMKDGFPYREPVKNYIAAAIKARANFSSTAVAVKIGRY
jgi:hypothetical protein